MQFMPPMTLMTHNLIMMLRVTPYIPNLLTPLLTGLYNHFMAFQLLLPPSMSLAQKVRPHIPSQQHSQHLEVRNEKMCPQQEVRGPADVLVL